MTTTVEQLDIPSFHPKDSPGETPISSSLELFHRARTQMPGFIDLLAEKGIKSSVTYTVERQYVGGSTLRQAFGKGFGDGDDEETKRRKVEAQIARCGRGEFTTFEWSDDADSQGQGQVLTLTHHLPAIRTQPGTHLPTLFTGLAAYYKNSLEARTGGNAGRKNVAVQTFGDATPIPEGTWQLWYGSRMRFGSCIGGKRETCWCLIMSLRSMEESPGRASRVIAWCWRVCLMGRPYGFGKWAKVVQALDG